MEWPNNTGVLTLSGGIITVTDSNPLRYATTHGQINLTRGRGLDRHTDPSVPGRTLAEKVATQDYVQLDGVTISPTADGTDLDALNGTRRYNKMRSTHHTLGCRQIPKSLRLAMVAVVMLGGTTFAKESTRKPNILFIFSDDLSYRDLSCYGQKEYSTPNLDALAMNGIRFTQTYSGSSECAPARASLMTGMHMGHCRIRANRSVRGQDHLRAEDITIAEVLKKAGYDTGFIGKWGIGLPGTDGTPDRQGFDFSYGYYDQLRAHGFFPHYLMRNGKPEPIPDNYGFNMTRVYGHSADKTGKHDNTYNENGRLIPDGVKAPDKAIHSEDLFQEEALAFIGKNRSKPFFLYYATQLPHGPCITPDLGPHKDKPWDQKHKEWAAMVEHMDRGVGRMVDLMGELDILEDTIVFFAGDNGYSQWGYMGRRKHEDDLLFKNKGPWPKGKFTCTHEGGVRVPFFAYWKGKIQAQESTHICALYDVLATTADLAGAAAPKTDGISLAPTLRGSPDEQQKHRYLYWENGSHSIHAQSLRMDQWWAFRNRPSDPIALYDIGRDINCRNNLAEDNQQIVQKVEQILKEAHADSQWYVNPGETREEISGKQRAAKNSMQNPTRPNTVYKGDAEQPTGQDCGSIFRPFLI